MDWSDGAHCIICSQLRLYFVVRRNWWHGCVYCCATRGLWNTITSRGATWSKPVSHIDSCVRCSRGLDDQLALFSPLTLLVGSSGFWKLPGSDVECVEWGIKPLPTHLLFSCLQFHKLTSFGDEQSRICQARSGLLVMPSYLIPISVLFISHCEIVG